MTFRRRREVGHGGLPAVARGSRRVGGDRPHRTGQPGVLHARQIEVTGEAAAQQVVIVTPLDVVAPQPHRDEGVDVQIDHVARPNRLHCLDRYPEVLR
jgi:hypothetical protein